MECHQLQYDTGGGDTGGVDTCGGDTWYNDTDGSDTGGGDTGGDSCGGDWVTWWRRERPGATDQGARGQEWDEACTQSSHPRDARHSALQRCQTLNGSELCSALHH